MNFGIEDETLEFKKSTSELDAACAAICAMLNKHGHGTILFGVLPNGEAKGLSVNESTLRDVSRKIYETISPRIIPNVGKRIADGSDLIEVTFKGEEKPYSCKGIYYIRSADENRILTPNELRQMFEYATHDTWDSRLSEFAYEDVDESSLKAFYDRALACGRIKEKSFDGMRLLEKTGLLKNGKLTNAGYLLFGKEEPITLKMAIFATDQKLTFLDINRRGGNIIKLLEEANGYIAKNIRWSVEYGGLERKEIPEIPMKAVREIICNSFVHARYGTYTQHEISIHPSFVRIYNPGEFPIGYKPEDFAQSNIPSVVRNPLLLKTLYLSGDVESYSSGFKRVYDECGKAGIKTSYEILRDGFTFIFGRKSLHVAPSVNEDDGLSEEEKAIIDVLKEDPTLSSEKISGLVNRGPRSVQRDLHNLKSRGYIERIGGTRGYWQIRYR